MPVRLLPDAERLVVTYLRAHPDVVALAGTRVSTELPPEPTYPAATVSRIGGNPSIAGYLDVATLEVSAWAATKGAARTLAAAAEAALLDMVGTHALGVVTGVRPIGVGVHWLPDEETDMPRYRFTVEAYIHPPVA